MTATAQSATAAVAHQLVALCRARRNIEVINRLYSQDIISVEPIGTDDLPAVLNGIDAIRQKNQWWLDNNEIHAAEAHGPFIGDDQFAVHYVFDITYKPTGERKQMQEMALYTVKDGRIVREQFFYNSPNED
ncbi:MAG: nuclear transport factor 2 family protein [Gemmatimonadota bacterium]